MANDVGQKSLDQIERETEASRGRLADTLSELRSRLSSDALKGALKTEIAGVKSDAMTYARDAGQQRVEGLKQKAQDNPVALALIGAGIAWPVLKIVRHVPIPAVLVGVGLFQLARSGSSGSRRSRDPYVDPNQGYVPGGVAGYGYPVEDEPPQPSATERVQSAVSSVRDAAREAGARAVEIGSDAVSQASGAIERAGSRVSGVVENTVAGVSGVARDVAAQVTGAAERAASTVTDAAQRTVSGVKETTHQGAAQVADAAANIGSTVSGLVGETETGRGSSPAARRPGPDRMVPRPLRTAPLRTPAAESRDSRRTSTTGGFDSVRQPVILGILGVLTGVLVGTAVRSRGDRGPEHAGRPVRRSGPGPRPTSPNRTTLDREPSRDYDASVGTGRGVGRGAPRRGAPARSSLSDHLSDRAASLGSTATEAGRTAYDRARDVGHLAASATRSVADDASGTASTVSRAASDVASTVSDAARRAYEAGLSSAYDAGYQAARFGRRAGSGISDLAESQPAILGALGLLIGAGIGAVLPTTEVENRVLGEHSEALKETALAAAADHLDDVKEAVERTVTGVAERAKEGLASVQKDEPAGSGPSQPKQPDRGTAQAPVGRPGASPGPTRPGGTGGV